jgi:hypothetical protein
MHDPYVLIGRLGPFDLWHRDKNGRDGACGWFMRASHGNPETLKKIESSFEFDWDRSTKLHNGTDAWLGLFTPMTDTFKNQFPNMSVHGVAINLFFLAALAHFGTRDKAMEFIKSELAEILLFAENPCDSAWHGWCRKYGTDGNEDREENIHKAAVMIYGWVLRATRPWYKHPRWHVHHWRITSRWLPALSSRILSD